MSLVSFLTVATLAVGASEVGKREALRTTSEGLVGLASTMVDRANRSISQRASMVEMLARVEAVNPVFGGDPAVARRLLQQSFAVISGGRSFRFANAEGVVMAAAGGGQGEGEDVAARSWFQRGLKGTAIESAEEHSYSLSGLAADGAPYAIVEIAAPVRDARGGPVGVLAFSMNWLAIANLRQETLNRSAQAGTKELWILSSDGRVIIGPVVGSRPYSDEVLAEMLASKRGSFSDDSKGDAILTGYAVMTESSSLGWIIAARQSEAIAFLPARRVVTIIVFLGLLTAALGVAASLLIASRLSRPITRLAREADLIERHSIEMLPRERGSLEVVRLSSALRALTLRIGFAEERTAQAELLASDAVTRLSDDIARLRSLADTDVMTQLLNRRRFLDLAAEAMQLFQQQGQPFGILMIDVDRFKSINDRFGHGAGDTAIQWVAEKIAAALRPTDIAARFGGEEFIVLVPDISLDAAEEMAERIRLRIASEPLHEIALNLFVTASIGVAVVEESDQDVEALIGRADLALYSAKAQGRNAVVCSEGNREARRVA